MNAARGNHSAKVQLLLDKGAAIDSRNDASVVLFLFSACFMMDFVGKLFGSRYSMDSLP